MIKVHGILRRSCFGNKTVIGVYFTHKSALKETQSALKETHSVLNSSDKTP